MCRCGRSSKHALDLRDRLGHVWQSRSRGHRCTSSPSRSTSRKRRYPTCERASALPAGRIRCLALPGSRARTASTWEMLAYWADGFDWCAQEREPNRSDVSVGQRINLSPDDEDLPCGVGSDGTATSSQRALLRREGRRIVEGKEDSWLTELRVLDRYPGSSCSSCSSRWRSLCFTRIEHSRRALRRSRMPGF